MKYAYTRTTTRQYMPASGAFQIENPDKAEDGEATGLAAKPLDDLLKKQS